MKTALLVTLVVMANLLSVPNARARLGETYDRCVARYGAPVEKLPPESSEMPEVETYRFKSDKWGVVVTFWKGKANSLAYYALDRKNPNIALGEIEAILKLNVPEREWVADQKNMWTVTLPDDIVTANYLDSVNTSLIINKLSYVYATQQYLKKNVRGL